MNRVRQVRIGAVNGITLHDDSPGGAGAEFADADRTLDARGLLCPEPLIQCRGILDQLETGATVHVIATDPHAEIDFEVFARRTPHEAISRCWQDGQFHVLIRKG